MREMNLHTARTVADEASGGRLTDIHQVQKSWGWEETFHNNQDYCMKRLVFDPSYENDRTSMHFHIHKRETLYVAEGRVTVTYVNNKVLKHAYLEAGDAFTVPRGLPHRIVRNSKTKAVVIEASTLDTPSDSIRLPEVKLYE